MKDIQTLKQMAADTLAAIEAFEKEGSIVNYKGLQTCTKRLQTAASTPTDVLFTFRLQVVENIGVMMLLELGILDSLVGRKGQTATAAELAKLSNCDATVVVRLMRLATALCFCDEKGEQAYASNAITEDIVKPGWKGAMRWMDIIYPQASEVRRYLGSASFDPAADQPSTLFQFVHGKSMWKVLEENPDQRVNFDKWMHERKKHEEVLWARRYPPMGQVAAASLKSAADALIVDVGGSTGSQLSLFRSQFPQLPGRFILQDLPETVAALDEKPEGIEVMAYDFFTPQPVKGARFYYLRSILHNWPDKDCLAILRNVVAAMDPDYSTLLIDDYVLPDVGAQLRSAVADIHMMCMFNSSERTEGEYRDMLRSVGLRVTAIYPAGVNEECIIEARVDEHYN